MSRSATIKSIPRAFRILKAMDAQGIEWGEGQPASSSRRCSRAYLTIPYWCDWGRVGADLEGYPGNIRLSPMGLMVLT